MEISDAILSLNALSQETRLNAFRILIAHGKKGIASGELSKELGIPPNTLSFHLAHLRHAGLVVSRKESRSVIYYANIDAMQELVEFLVEDCCIVDKTTCGGIEKVRHTVKKIASEGGLKKTCC